MGEGERYLQKKRTRERERENRDREREEKERERERERERREKREERERERETEEGERGLPPAPRPPSPDNPILLWDLVRKLWILDLLFLDVWKSELLFWVLLEVKRREVEVGRHVALNQGYGATCQVVNYSMCKDGHFTNLETCAFQMHVSLGEYVHVYAYPPHPIN